jgi:hypothetical protein
MSGAPHRRVGQFMLREMRAGFSQRFAARTSERDRHQGTASGTGPVLMRTFG